MLNKKPAVYSLFLASLIVTLLCRIVPAYLWNLRLEKNFVPSTRQGAENEPYRIGLPMEEWDPTEYTYRYTFPNGGMASRRRIFTLTRDVHWYERPDQNSPVAATLTTGTSYLVGGEYYRPLWAEGCFSWPTYKKGWRYCTPFLTPEEIDRSLGDGSDIPSRERQKRYYVRLEDLYYLCEMGAQGLPQPDQTVSLRTKEPPYFVIDFALYRNGCYLSPDLFKPLWDWNCTVLAAGIVLLFVLERLLAKLQNKTAGKILPSRPLKNKGNRGKFVRGRHTI